MDWSPPEGTDAVSQLMPMIEPVSEMLVKTGILMKSRDMRKGIDIHALFAYREMLRVGIAIDPRGGHFNQEHIEEIDTGNFPQQQGPDLPHLIEAETPPAHQPPVQGRVILPPNERVARLVAHLHVLESAQQLAPQHVTMRVARELDLGSAGVRHRQVLVHLIARCDLLVLDLDLENVLPLLLAQLPAEQDHDCLKHSVKVAQ